MKRASAKRPGRTAKRADSSPAGRGRLAALLCALLAFGLYANTLGHGYTLDDAAVLRDNRLTTAGLASVPALFTTSYRAGYDPSLDDGLYRPLPLVVFATEWQLWPDSPHAYHAVNVACYALSAALLCLVLARLLGSGAAWPAGIATALFVAHPLHTEVVASIKSLDEILAGLFVILAIGAAVWLDGPSSRRQALVAVAICAWLAALSKESAVTVVAIVPALLWFSGRRDRGRLAIPTIACAMGVAVALAMRLVALVRSPGGPTAIDPVDNVLVTATTVGARLASAFGVLGREVRLLLVPHPLVYDYSPAATRLVGWSSGGAIAGLLVSIGLLVFAVWAARRPGSAGVPIRLAGMGAALFLIAILPVSNLIVLIGTAMAERLLYLPSLGFCLMATGGLLFVQGVAGTRGRRIVGGLVALIVAVDGTAVLARNRAWRDDDTLFSTDIRTAPESARIQYDLGLSLVRDRLPAAADREARASVLGEAVTHLSRAIAIAPPYPDAHSELGVALEDLGRHEDAIAEFQRAIAVNGRDAQYYNNLGVAEMSLRRFDAAVRAYTQAATLAPGDATATLNLGVAYGSLGDYARAIDLMSTAAHLQPQNPAPYANLAITYRRMGDFGRAAEAQARADALSAGGSR